MPRPKKNNADYFSHDVGMRNDTKILAVRTKFGIEGYAVWSMMLEKLTDSENFEVIIDDIGLELLAGDFQISSEKLNKILDYFVQIQLLVLDVRNKKYWSENLKKRLQAVVDNRLRKREWSTKRWEKDVTNEVLDVQKPVTDVYKTSKTIQSKVKESKVNILYSEQNKKNGDYVDFDRFRLKDGTIAVMRWGKWVDEKNTEININKDGYKELP